MARLSPNIAAHSHMRFPIKSPPQRSRKAGVEMATSTAWPGEVGKAGMLPAVLLHPCDCPGQHWGNLGLVNGMGAFLPSIPGDRGTSDASYCGEYLYPQGLLSQVGLSPWAVVQGRQGKQILPCMQFHGSWDLLPHMPPAQPSQHICSCPKEPPTHSVQAAALCLTWVSP